MRLQNVLNNIGQRFQKRTATGPIVSCPLNISRHRVGRLVVCVVHNELSSGEIGRGEGCRRSVFINGFDTFDGMGRDLKGAIRGIDTITRHLFAAPCAGAPVAIYNRYREVL